MFGNKRKAQNMMLASSAQGRKKAAPVSTTDICQKRRPYAMYPGNMSMKLRLMQSALARLGHVLLALDQRLDLLGNLVQAAQNDLVALDESVALVFELRLLAKLAHQNLSPAEIVPRDAREKMVDGLELQAAVEKVQPRRAIDVHGGAQLALRERLAGAEVRGGHAPVREGDLDMQDNGRHVREDDEGDADGPRRQVQPNEAVAEKIPVAAHEGNLQRTGPPGSAQLSRPRAHQVQPRQHVEVEPGKGHDRVVCVLLDRDHEVGGAVPGEGEVVERGEDGFHIRRGGGEERRVLDVGVVLGRVGDEVVHVVGRLPPADAEAAAKVGDEGPDDGVGDEFARDAHVAGVVGGEHDLLLRGVLAAAQRLTQGSGGDAPRKRPGKSTT
jgi:hypothetical protein